MKKYIATALLSFAILSVSAGNKPSDERSPIKKSAKVQENYKPMNINDLPTVSKAHLNTKFSAKEVENAKAFVVKDEFNNSKIYVSLKGSEDVVYSLEGYLLRYVK